MKQLTLALAVLCVSGIASAQVTKPIRYTWIATACENWDCAASAFILSAGDGNTIVLPTGNEKHPWLLLRRVEEGAIFIPETEPFTCEVFEKLDGAVTRHSELAPCHAAMTMNTPDGRAVVLSMRNCEDATRRRSAGH
jgi:hypothetical protein